MKNQWSVLIVFSLLVNSSLATELKKEKNIKLGDYLQQVKDKHPFFKQQSLNRRIEQAQQESIKGNEDWIIKSNPNFIHAERSPGNNAFVAQQQDTLSFTTGVERHFWNNGSRLSIDYDYYHSDQDFSAPTGTIDEYNNGINVSYAVPLMKNRGGVLSRLDYELQAYSINQSKLNSIENQEQFLEQQGLLFLDWVFVNEQRRITLNRLELAKQELIRTQKKRKAKLVEKVDVLRAKDAIIKTRQNLGVINSQWNAIQAQLATQVKNPDLYQTTPSLDLYTLKTVPSLVESITNLKQDSRQIKAINFQIAQTKQLKNGYSNKLKPELDLVLSGGLSSQANKVSDSTKFDKPQYSIGIKFRYPLGQRTAKAKFIKTALQQQQLIESRMNLQTQLEANLRNLVTQMSELYGVIELNKEQISIARLRTKEELNLHNKGRSELSFVIQSRDNEQNAQLAYAVNAAKYHKLYLYFEALTDSLLPNSDII